jgi:hypothetical protein
MQSPPASEEPSLLLDCFSPKTNRSSALFFFKVLADEYRGVFQAVFLINMASFPKSSDPELLNRTSLKIRPKNSLRHWFRLIPNAWDGEDICQG